MTGIERLRELARIWTWDCKMVVEQKKLADIAGQIERERDEERSRWDDELCDAQMDKTCVMAVYLEMNRHVLGHEGMEDSPVARWARELREALGGDGRDPAADVSVSACDPPSQEDREAIAWVREHGGLDAVKRRWECLSYYADPVPRSCMEKRLARLQRQIDESHAALRRRNARIGFLVSELNRANHENHEEFMRRSGDYTAFTDEVCKRLAPELRYVEGCSKDVMDAALDALDRRLMPEGMEWPRFESGEPVMLGDSVVKYVAGGEFEVRSIEFRDGAAYLREGFRTEGIVIVRPGERVRRPSKVLDADGVEIRVGDTVCGTQDMEPMRVVDADSRECGFKRIKCEKEGDGFFFYCADELTHKLPVLAADGKPLREGETVYDIEDAKGYPHTVASIELGGLGHVNTTCEEPTPASVSIHPSRLTHQRPVLDADGVPIKVGDTVWMVDDPDGPYRVTKVTTKYATHVYGYSDEFGDLDMSPSQLTHERHDSLDRLAEDIGAMVVAWRSNRDLFDAQEAAAGCVGENTLGAALDSLARRARALAGDA